MPYGVYEREFIRDFSFGKCKFQRLKKWNKLAESTQKVNRK